VNKLLLVGVVLGYVVKQGRKKINDVDTRGRKQ